MQYSVILLTLSLLGFCLAPGLNHVVTYILPVGPFQYDLVLVSDYQVKCGGLLVLFVSGMVFMFASHYMSGDKYTGRFLFVLFLFVVSMLILLVGASITLVLVGWDGLGVTSFLLILYYNSTSNIRSGAITYAVNRLGDGLIMACMIYFLGQGTTQLLALSGALGLILAVAAMTKSAGYPFSVWLPLAMDAPTPVSALVHSSTLVTAGLFLLSRFEFSSLPPLILMGSFTFLVGSCAACFATDIKKIIACSTLSHLGLMTLTLGLGKLDLLLFHLITHALFKAALFMLAGTFLMSEFGVQDSRALHRLSSPLLKAVSIYFTLSSLSLFAFSTFYSKHSILSMVNMTGISPAVLPILVLGVVLSAFYSFRLMGMFLTESNSTVQGQVPAPVLVPIVALALASLVLGNYYAAASLFEFAFEGSGIPLLATAAAFLLLHKTPSAFGLQFFFLNPVMDKPVSLRPIKTSTFWALKC